MKLVQLFLVLIFGVSGTVAEQPSTDISSESKELLQQMEKQIKGTLMTVSEIETRAGNNMSDFYYSLELPATQQANLGMVIDFNDFQNGYSVISVTPGSLADEQNIVAGDRIVAIDQVKLNSANVDNTISQLQNIQPEQPLNLTIARNGINQEINLIVKGEYIPALKFEIGNPAFTSEQVAENEVDQKTECGTVSVFFTPPEVKDYYPAFFSRINGKGVLRAKDTFRLPTGMHRIHLHELITDPFLNRKGRGPVRAKYLDINIEANTYYQLAAKFNRAKSYKEHRGEHWEPVIWKTTEQKCVL